MPTMQRRTVNIYSLVRARVGMLILLTPAGAAASKTYIVTPGQHCCSVGLGWVRIWAFLDRAIFSFHFLHKTKPSTADRALIAHYPYKVLTCCDGAMGRSEQLQITRWVPECCPIKQGVDKVP